jgi:hypothetical protein
VVSGLRPGDLERLEETLGLLGNLDAIRELVEVEAVRRIDHRGDICRTL